MSKLVWDADGSRFYETGVKNCALYVKNGVNGAYANGVAWNGITAITESPSGAEANPMYADDMKYLNLLSVEEFGATVEAYTYPDAFNACQGIGTIMSDGDSPVDLGIRISQQSRKQFGLAYKTVLGNDVEGNDFGYKIHIIYNALAAPSERAYATINDSPEAITFSWELTTTPMETGIEGVKATAHLTIDSTAFTTTEAKANFQLLEDYLFGRDSSTSPSVTAIEPTLLTPSQIVSVLENGALG